jgi:hypothetical protein
MFMVNTEVTIAAALIFMTIALTVTTSGILTNQKAIPANGSVTHSTGIGIYTDQDARATCTDIYWGSLTADTANTRVI